MRAFVIGNGPSLEDTPLELLGKERTFAVNRIWKIFDQTTWRPTDYVRCELPEYDGGDVCEDLKHMSKTAAKLWIQAGFFRYAARTDVAFGRPVTPFSTCNGGVAHDWHFDLGDNICGYGTVVQVAIQLAVLGGAKEIYLVGCDLGQPSHFYGDEGINNDDKNIRAHEIVKECCPVPIFNATVGGGLEVYKRVNLKDLFNEKEKAHSNGKNRKGNARRRSNKQGKS